MKYIAVKQYDRDIDEHVYTIMLVNDKGERNTLTKKQAELAVKILNEQVYGGIK